MEEKLFSAGRAREPLGLSRMRRPQRQPRRSSLLCLTHEVHLRIAWALAGGSASGGIAALSAASPDLAELLLEEGSPFWIWKINATLGASAWERGLPAQLRTAASPRRLYLCVASVGLLLQHALASCDWLALSDAFQVLTSAGANSPQLLLLVFREVSAHSQQRPPLQALQWLWDLSSGALMPWSERARPSPGATNADPLRKWLRRQVSQEILTWQELPDHLGEFDGQLARHMQRRFAVGTVCSARCMLLALECTPPSAAWLSSPKDHRLSAVASAAHLAMALEAALCSEMRTVANESFWILLLLLLARCLRVCESLPTDAPPSLLKPSSGDCGWRGISVAWHRGHADRDLPPSDDMLGASGYLELVHFPRLEVDWWTGWLHTQHGSCGDARRGPGGGSTVQLDARFNVQADCFLGEWLEYPGAQPSMPAHIVSLTSWCGGLRSCMAPGEADAAADARAAFDPFASGDDAFSRFGAAAMAQEDEAVELAGVVGGDGTDVIRCFHLTSCKG